MLTKLSLRNAGRTWKDYLVFFVTLVLIAAIMFSFNGLLFDPDIRTLETDSYIIAVMLGIATFFILLVLAWLILHDPLHDEKKEPGIRNLPAPGHET